MYKSIGKKTCMNMGTLRLGLGKPSVHCPVLCSSVVGIDNFYPHANPSNPPPPPILPQPPFPYPLTQAGWWVYGGDVESPVAGPSCPVMWWRTWWSQPTVVSVSEPPGAQQTPRTKSWCLLSLNLEWSSRATRLRDWVQIPFHHFIS